MSRVTELVELINSLPEDTLISSDSLIQCDGFTEGNRYIISTTLSKFCRSGFLVREGRGTYKRVKSIPVPRSYVSKEERYRKENFEELPDGKIKVVSKRKRKEGSRAPDERIIDNDGKHVLGERESKGIHLKLTNTKLIDLIVNNDIEFRVKLRCSRVEKNFQGEVTSLSLDAIDITIDESDGR